VDNLVYDNLFEENALAGVHSGKFGTCKLNFIYANKMVNNGGAAGDPGCCSSAPARPWWPRTRLSAPPTARRHRGDGRRNQRNYIFENTVHGYQAPVLKRGGKTVVGDKFPGDIPPIGSRCSTTSWPATPRTGGRGRKNARPCIRRR